VKLNRVLVALVLFGVGFGYVEAAVVVYLRAICEPIRREVLAGEPHDEVFPTLTLADLEAAGPEYLHVLYTELGRELATMLMLAAIGLTIACNFRQWIAGFMIAFGVWDIFYYVFLRLLLGWPASLLTWDVLFLWPVPWVGPVLGPVLVAASMVVVGVVILRRESAARPVLFGRLDWIAIVGGGLVIIVAFCWDFRNVLDGGRPETFNWPLFALGEAVSLAGFTHALRLRPETQHPASLA